MFVTVPHLYNDQHVLGFKFQLREQKRVEKVHAQQWRK